eukprot:jgi/Chlat1/8142/Chrsp75S07601
MPLLSRPQIWKEVPHSKSHIWNSPGTVFTMKDRNWSSAAFKAKPLRRVVKKVVTAAHVLLQPWELRPVLLVMLSFNCESGPLKPDRSPMLDGSLAYCFIDGAAPFTEAATWQ